MSLSWESLFLQRFRPISDSGKFLKDRARILAKPISELYNLSVTFRNFPDAYKVAKLKPLFKKIPETDPSNYRPISLIPLLSKAFGRIVLDQTNDFLNHNNILYSDQSGVQTNHPTETSLPFLNDNILKCSDHGLLRGTILIDLEKAFDTINHDILLKKWVLWVFLMMPLNGFNLINQIKHFL